MGVATHTSERVGVQNTHKEMSYFDHLSKAQCYQSCMLILEGCSVQSHPPWSKISLSDFGFPQSGWSLTDGQYNFGKHCIAVC